MIEIKQKVQQFQFILPITRWILITAGKTIQIAERCNRYCKWQWHNCGPFTIALSTGRSEGNKHAIVNERIVGGGCVCIYSVFCRHRAHLRNSRIVTSVAYMSTKSEEHALHTYTHTTSLAYVNAQHTHTLPHRTVSPLIIANERDRRPHECGGKWVSLCLLPYYSKQPPHTLGYYNNTCVRHTWTTRTRR